VIAVDLQDTDAPLTLTVLLLRANGDDTSALLKRLEIEQTTFSATAWEKGRACNGNQTSRTRAAAGIYGAAYKSFEESFPRDALKVFKEITPETFAPKDLKEHTRKYRPLELERISSENTRIDEGL